MGQEVLGVHEFRASLPAILQRLHETGTGTVLVGPYRRAVAALVPIERIESLRGDTGSPNLPAIRELLRLSPQERLEGLANAADFFAAASRA
jgi:hypothetical protein